MSPRRRDKKGATPKRIALAVLTEEERVEYANRHNLMINKQMELMSVSNYMNQFQDTLVEKYGLPTQFDLNIPTGEIYEREKELEDAPSV